MPHLTSLNAVPTNVLWEHGNLYVNSVTPYAATTGGGMRFEPNDTWVNIAEDIDGVYHKIAGAEVKTGGNPTISGTIVQLTDAILTDLSPGVGVGVAVDVTTFTPFAAGSLLAAGGAGYLVDVRAVWALQGSSDYFVVHFPVGFVSSFVPRGGGKGEKGGVDITIEARGLAADIAAGTAPYKMYLTNVATTPEA